MKNKFFPALAVLVGTIIGAGFLGIPYVVSKSGFIPGIILLAFVAGFMLLIKLYLGEIALRTKGNHQLTGYAEKYLGRKGKWLMFLSMFFGIYGALTAYLIAEGKSFSYMFFGNFDYSLLFSLGFWIVLAVLSFDGLSALKRYEKIAMFFVISLIIVIVGIFSFKIDVNNLNYIGSFKQLFIPFGVMVFSFLAFSSMPEVKRILSGQEGKMKKVILWAAGIAFFVYLIFVAIIIGVYGRNVEEIATLNLGRFFSLLGILTMFTAFFTQTIAIRDMFRFDFSLGRFRGWLLACFIPLAAFLIVYYFNLASFISIISLAGVISGGLAAVLILIMNHKAKKLGNRKPEYSVKINWWIITILSLIFIAAVVFECVR